MFPMMSLAPPTSTELSNDAEVMMNWHWCMLTVGTDTQGKLVLQPKLSSREATEVVSVSSRLALIVVDFV